jgi:hypothetical protein
LAACGSDEKPAPAPRLPHALGARLAGQADAIAASLERDDGCDAQKRLLALRIALNRSLAQVPRRLREDLSVGVNAIGERVRCVPAVASEGEGDQPGKGKGRGKHKGKGKGE